MINNKTLLSIIGLFFLCNCTHVISSNMRKNVDANVSLESVFKDADTYKGKNILLGGIIIQTINSKDNTQIEALEQERDSYGKSPGKTDKSLGRFILIVDGFLDDAIYKSGREFTVAGEVRGTRISKIGEAEYRYPLIKSKELYLLSQYPDYKPPISYGIGIGIENRF